MFEVTTTVTLVIIAHVSTFHVVFSFMAHNDKIYSMATLGMMISQNSLTGAEKLSQTSDDTDG